MKKNYNKYVITTRDFIMKRFVYILFLLTLVIRILYSFFAFQNNLFEESNAYIDIAREIIEQRSFFYDASDPYYDSAGPVMPWINAITIYIFGDNLLFIFFVTAFASSLIVVTIYKFALLLFDKTVAIFSGIWSAISPLYLYFIPNAGKDTWMAFFLIFLLYYLVKMFNFKQYTHIRFIVFTIVFVVSFHLDERYVMFAPIFFLYILYAETDKFRIPVFSKTGLFTFLVILLMLPWAIRNYNRYDRIVLLSTRTERITDKLFGLEPREHVLDRAYGTDLYYIHDYQIDSVISGLKTRTDGGSRIPEGQRKAMESGDMPKHFNSAEAFWSRFKTMYRPFQIGGVWERSGYYYYEKSLAHNAASAIFYGIMLVFSFPGFYLLYKKHKTVFFLLISVLMIYSAIHLLTIPYTVWRYRIPLDPMFIIVGSYGMINFLKFIGFVKSKPEN